MARIKKTTVEILTRQQAEEAVGAAGRTQNALNGMRPTLQTIFSNNYPSIFPKRI
jgi:hypothetical protein